MGRRAILAMVLLGSLIAAGQVWLASAMLSKPLPSGKTGWETVATAAKPKQERRPGMPLAEVVSVGPCGNVILGQFNDTTITLRILSTNPGSHLALDATIAIRPNPPDYFAIGNTLASYRAEDLPVELTESLNGDLSGIPSGTYELYYGTMDFTLGQFVYEPLGAYLVIDHDTLPSFLGPYVGSDDCGPPVTFQVSTEIHHAESWSYQLYAGETPISGGSPGAGTHELDGCSGYAHVTDIPSNATRITFTATNGNGSSTVSSNLALPIPSVSIEADPSSIFEEQETTLNWSAAYAPALLEAGPGEGNCVEPCARTLRLDAGGQASILDK